MATLRRLARNRNALPQELAAGPDPARWAPNAPEGGRRAVALRAWHSAGKAWAADRGMTGLQWRALLPEDVRYALSALGRAHHLHGGLTLPWETSKSTTTDNRSTR